MVTSSVSVEGPAVKPFGFGPAETPIRVPLTFDVLSTIYESTPGLVSDKIKAVLEFACHHLSAEGRSKVIFAYDEAQNLSDNATKDQFPLSVLLDVFQSIQKKGIPFMLLLTGLPTLFPKLVDARTYSERMFRVVMLGRLSDDESREAILKPIEMANCPVKFDENAVQIVTEESGGYPYFVQFICREIYDVFVQQAARGEPMRVPVDAIQRKLDTDFFAGRWAKVTDRQRELLWAIATLDHPDDEFTIQELITHTKDVLGKPFSGSHANQMLSSLAQQGLIYKNRFGKYSFAVPLLGAFIQRTYVPPT